ncbi:MAG: ribosomal protein S18-alanine N-acetyltransferase [Nannocystaceae bacterium]
MIPQIRAATPIDLPAICEVDRACFDSTWPLPIYAEELVRERSTVRVATCECHGVAALICGSRVLDEAHVLRVATRAEHRNRGLAKRLVFGLVRRAQRVGCAQVHLEVASRNRAALALYRDQGFEAVGRRARYYRSPKDDAILMTLHLR